MPEELKNKILEIGRWVAVMPGAILSGLLILFPLHWVLYFTLVKGSIIEMPLENMAPIERFLSPIFTSMIFVYVRAKIAPKKQFLVSIILFTLNILFRISAVFFVAKYNFEVDMPIYGISRLILSVLAGGIGVFLIYIDTNKNLKRKIKNL